MIIPVQSRIIRILIFFSLQGSRLDYHCIAGTVWLVQRLQHRESGENWLRKRSWYKDVKRR